MRIFNKSKAKIEILNYIVNICTNIYSSNGMRINLDHPEHGFKTSLFNKNEIPLNTIVRISAANHTKYYLSWLREIKENGVYLTESIEDGSLCNWSNVSIYYLPIKTINIVPSWRWNDKQFKIKEQWFRACFKTKDCYVIRPCVPEFNQDGSFTLSLRKIFESEIIAKKTFKDYNKVLVRDMLQFYDNTYLNLNNKEAKNGF